MTSASTTEQSPPALVHLVDDDASVRAAVEDLLASVGLDTRSYVSAADFLERARLDAPGCLVLDVRMPGMNGLDLQQELQRRGLALPIIFITGHGDIPMSVRAMKQGALEFLTKPFRDQDLLDAIDQALRKAQEAHAQRRQLQELQTRLDTLNDGERAVLARVVTGLLNKQIAAQLGVSEITVKVRRAALMRKLQAGSLAELVKMVERLEASRG
ncbi:LuxR family two component transcriptional regulator [Pseudomonas psychrotolerans L19]|uniref:response regulator transcription factor n=1 Tax=Pseudomonas TaxID=286 RepID=UPI00023A4751|nr:MULTISPECIES: response regulator transcription factor [Pseudomonas]EHK72789.1 LuxR family two component transcriptional regulator [Pseudomonas psychrotolerans L19]MBA1179292.1 response regulator transcription factor [Pseudomonas psychrotolerans]MBA1211720.1 response regulator transcription factor [Pseudomonas psychrotolerans]TCQ92437.1 LuxR family two component transcriptional regulator [Pseudomonas sp. JUb52]